MNIEDKMSKAVAYGLGAEIYVPLEIAIRIAKEYAISVISGYSDGLRNNKVKQTTEILNELGIISTEEGGE